MITGVDDSCNQLLSVTEPISESYKKINEIFHCGVYVTGNRLFTIIIDTWAQFLHGVEGTGKEFSVALIFIHFWKMLKLPLAET